MKRWALRFLGAFFGDEYIFPVTVVVACIIVLAVFWPD